MKEKEIRDRDTHKKYLELVKIDSQKIFSDKSNFIYISCPACGLTNSKLEFEKDGFSYSLCPNCESLFNNPRPSYSDLQKLYKNSESTKYWIDHFFTPFIEARREKIFKPRAEYITTKFPELNAGKIGDIGAGFGLFFEELKKIWTCSNLVAIEPSDDMSAICLNKGFNVIKKMLEDVDPQRDSFDLLTSFELIEHLHDPSIFFKNVYSLLNKNGYFYFTTLNGLGFDIQTLWNNSKSIAPPHHLNFFNPYSIKILLERLNFEVVEISTPGKLDWEIVENSFIQDAIEIDRFWKNFIKYGTEIEKMKFQNFLTENNLSSHLRVTAKKR